MKKIILITAALSMLSAGITAQSSGKKIGKKNFHNPSTSVQEKSSVKSGLINGRGCGTKIPPRQWDEAFNKMVETHKANVLAGRTATTTYTIPIIFHIIYSSATESVVGTGHNISQAQVNSQIPILNADYNGTGYNSNLYAALTYSGEPAFYQYAALATNSVSPSSLASNGSIAIGASGIYFCLAGKDASGTTLAEPGIDRVAWQSVSGATDPASSNDVETLMDGTIKPATIWDPTKYFNVWVSDGGSSGLLGYATFPPSSTTGTGAISPNWGESNGYSCTTDDGVWVAYNALGNTGAAASPYNKGRTLTHESGHWLGLRHIWGDGSCVTDYCNDTPPAAAANYVNCTTGYPYHSGTCSANSPDGEMIMNFMDYSDDCAMYMFTTDQVNRFHAALTLSPCRTGLTASASAICSGIATTAPVADFTYPSSICANVGATFADASTGPPTSWSWSVTPSATIATSTSQNPSITFPSTGTYTVTLAATNTISTSSASHIVTVTSCSVTTCDTITNFVNSDTLTIFQLPQGVSDSGYVSGNNIYGDLAKAEYYSSTNLANTQIKSVIVLFFRSGTVGTKGTGTVSLDILNGNTTTGPSGAALGTATASLASIAASTPTANVDYCGNPGLAFPSSIIVPYKFTFATPVTTPTSGFFASLNLPTTTGDTLVVFQNTDFGIAHNVSTAWELNAGSPATWGDVQSDWGFNNPVSFSILPIVCPLVAGIEQNELGSNISLFPNPNNGQFNFAVTLAEPTNLNFTVVNTLGQVVYIKSINNISNGILNCDLSNLAKGIYYANITDSNNHKTVKKIVIE